MGSEEWGNFDLLNFVVNYILDKHIKSMLELLKELYTDYEKLINVDVSEDNEIKINRIMAMINFIITNSYLINNCFEEV